MEIRLAKTAGFCFGVNRAVELTYNLLNEGHKVATLGPLIHNPQAVADMERRGALVADTVDDIPTGYEVIIRSHGVPRTIYDTLEQRGLVYHDATCPFVKKIQSIAARAEAEGAVLLVAGDAAHPEVQGIVGHTRGEVFVFSDLDEETKNQLAMRAQGQAFRILTPTHRKDEEGRLYSLNKNFLDEYLTFPFCVHDDLIDAMSRIYDIEAVPPVIVDESSLEPETFADGM